MWTFNMHYSELAWLVRNDMAVTQKELAKSLGCSMQYICNVEAAHYAKLPMKYFTSLYNLVDNDELKVEVENALRTRAGLPIL